MRDAVIVDGVRTPIGRMGGSLARFRPEELGALTIEALVKKTHIDPMLIDDVFMGISNTWHAAYHPARWAVIKSGLPYRVPAVTVERACASSLQSIVLAAMHIRSDMGEVFISGGMESWSQCPWMIGRSESEAYAFVAPQIIKRDTAPPPDDTPMGLTAESLATMYGVTREEQDAFGFRSQERALNAIETGIFKEETFPVTIPQKKGAPLVFELDEHPRKTTMEKLASLSPAFKKDGTVTAGTACGRNDGGSACLVMERKRAEELGYKPLARFVTFAAEGVDPKLMGIGPAFAIPKALKRAGMRIEDMDVIEINEAFAAQVLADIKDLDKQGIHIDPVAINPNGGAIALGHPNGATGARLALTMVRELHRRKARYGLISLCIGGGQGLAVILERID